MKQLVWFHLPHNCNCKIVEWIEQLSGLFVDSANLCLWSPLNCYFIGFCRIVPWSIITSIPMVTIYTWDVSLPLFLPVEKEKRTIIIWLMALSPLSWLYITLSYAFSIRIPQFDLRSCMHKHAFPSASVQIKNKCVNFMCDYQLCHVYTGQV